MEKLNYKRIMKASIILMIVGIGAVSANSYSQNVLLSLKVHNKTLKDVFRLIEDQSEYIFLYNDEDINENKRVDVSVEKGTIYQIMDRVLGKESRYVVEDRQVIIYKDHTADAASNKATATNMKPDQAKKTITGKVTDREGESLIGVVVSLKKTTTAVTTDIDGRFNLTVDDAPDIIIHFQLLGKKPLDVRYTGQKEMKVVMEDAIEEIQDVVITGIFNKPRESYTGAVTLITAEDLKNAGNQSIISRIGNIDPSFLILENNIMGSDPNTLPNIQMRGNTSLTVGVRQLQDDSRSRSESNLPLFILDGFEVGLQEVMDLDPYLVESVTLLKDASATAMYGSRGANGIMVITKKQPKQGKLRVTYKGDLQISAPDLTSYHLLNAADKLEYESAAGLYTYSALGYQVQADQLYSKRRAEVERGVDTYWLKYPVRVGIGQRHSLRFDGGDNSLLYSAGLSYDNNLGIMKESRRNTISGNIYLQYSYKNVKFRNDFGVSSNKAYNSPYGEFSLYARLNPYWTPYEDDGSLKKTLDNYQIPSYGTVYTPGNPLYDATLPYRNDSGYDQYYDNFSVHWDIRPGLSLLGSFRMMKDLVHGDVYVSARHSTFNQYYGEDYIRRGSYDKTDNTASHYDGNITANYNKTFNKIHQLSAGFNFNFGQDKSEGNTIKAEGYAASNLHQFGLANSYEKDGAPKSSDSYSRRLGSVLSINYTYAGRYYMDLSGKMDGSSRFGLNNRMAPFWSAGIGWNMHNESFLKDLAAVNYLRWRASYGTTGSQNFNPYQARTTFQFNKNRTYQHWTGSYMIAMGNPDLKWQSTKQFNGGFEYSLFNRWRMNVDFYNKLTYGVLMDINLPIAGGFDSYKANMGEVQNKGFEITTSVFLIRNTEKNISWSIGGSVLQNKNKVLKISNAMDFLNEQIGSDPDNYRNPSFLVKEGESLNTIFAVKSLGIDPSTGREIFEKLDGTHTFAWDAKDRIACGVSDPDLWGNFNTMFRYKGFSLSVTFAYRTGGYKYNQTLVNKVENVDPWYNVDERVYNDRWKQPGDLARFKSVQLYSSNTNASTRFVMKENTVECRSVNLAYEVDPQWLRKNFGMDFLSLGLYSENPFYFSSIRQERGTSYPFARNYSFSLTTRF